MAAHVIFFSPRGIASIDAPGIGDVRVREVVAVPGMTETETRDGEIVLIANEGTGSILAAYGKSPDAAALVSTSSTSAGLLIQAGRYSPPIVPRAGDKFAFVALA